MCLKRKQFMSAKQSAESLPFLAMFVPEVVQVTPSLVDDDNEALALVRSSNT